jgi:hypothetical protein
MKSTHRPLANGRPGGLPGRRVEQRREKLAQANDLDKYGEMIDRVLGSDDARVAWVMGFLVGSALVVDGHDAAC